MTIKQRERVVARAIKRLDAAIESLEQLSDIGHEFGVDDTMESEFRRELRERADYWERAQWWKKEPAHD